MIAQLLMFDITPDSAGSTFKDWQLREGERLYNKGAQALNNTELLAHIIRDKEIAERIIDTFSTLNAIAKASINELMEMANIGRPTAEKIVAGFEFARRVMAERNGTDSIKGASDVFDLLSPHMSDLQQEELRVILLNTKNDIIKIETIFIGSLNTSVIHPREIFKAAIRVSANAIVMVHNHPSGDPTGSSQDTKLTKQIYEAGKLMGIELVDHIIIGKERFFSFKEARLI